MVTLYANQRRNVGHRTHISPSPKSAQVGHTLRRPPPVFSTPNDFWNTAIDRAPSQEFEHGLRVLKAVFSAQLDETALTSGRVDRADSGSGIGDPQGAETLPLLGGSLIKS